MGSMHPIIRVALTLIVCLAAMASHASAVSVVTRGDEAFRAGSYVKVGRLVSLHLDDLRHASKADNIDGLLELAKQEKRIDTIRMMQLRPLFLKKEAGDQLLLTCLRHETCQPEIFSRIQATSRLHSDIVCRNPSLRFVKTNQEVGALTERLMHRFFEGSGWTRVPGEVGRQGIDGLYVKLDGGIVKDVLIAESKYNTSILQSTNHGTQMSADWVTRKIANLQARSPGDSVYTAIRELVDKGGYRAVLWQFKVNDDEISVALTKLVGKGRTVTPEFGGVIDGVPSVSLTPIKFGSPTNKFESDFLGWYRDEIDGIGALLD